MGRIVKRFVAQTGTGAITGRGQVDSGADQTVLSAKLACRIGLDPARPGDAEVYVAEGTRVVGFALPVTITVGARRATVEAFVPSYSEVDGRRRKAAMPNLIGADFLQASTAKLDYGRPHRSTFAGFSPFRWKRVRPTKRDLQGLRRFRCP